MRHAKSSWDNSDLADFDRPLNDRGEAAAPFMGELIAGRGLAPEEIVSSPAKRALQTATLVKESGGIEAPIRLDERIYEAGAQTLKQVASEFRDELDIMMMIGHNPGFEELARLLIGEGDMDGILRLGQKYPTAGLAVIDFALEDWADVAHKSGRLERFVTPKSLGNGEDD